MLKIIYAFCKVGEEGDGWRRDVEGASNERFTFIPFNYCGYGDLNLMLDAVGLDRLYQTRAPELMRLYSDFNRLVEESGADAVVVCDAPPFHPDYLKSLPLYKVLYTHDDPESTYQRHIPYIHAYQHIFYVTPAYTKDMDMEEKLSYCGVQNKELVPNGALTFDSNSSLGEQEVFGKVRDIDLLYIGAFYRGKSAVLMRLKQEFGKKFHWHGYVKPKHNAYLSVMHRHFVWVRPVSFSQRRNLYQRAKIAINLHNGYDVPNTGNQRMFYAPANGAMLLTDGIDHLAYFFKPDEEAVGYRDADDLVEKIRYYIARPSEREAIARKGYRRVVRDYRFIDITRRAGELIRASMTRMNWDKR